MINSGISTDERRDAQDEGWQGCFDELERVWPADSTIAGIGWRPN